MNNNSFQNSFTQIEHKFEFSYANFIYSKSTEKVTMKMQVKSRIQTEVFQYSYIISTLFEVSSNELCLTECFQKSKPSK